MNSDTCEVIDVYRTLRRSVHRSAVGTFEKAGFGYLAEKNTSSSRTE